MSAVTVTELVYFEPAPKVVVAIGSVVIKGASVVTSAKLRYCTAVVIGLAYRFG